ncbi:MAG: hypothetical protein A2W31_00590 [Planctomycetes bacterium RBG_16_64_10]|nr:MAG: hypothetical protein A2W31_00590 [Planctomycetes bacterium RBG_16_64_10]
MSVVVILAAFQSETSPLIRQVYMFKLPRVAVGTVQPAADVVPMVWALSSLFERSGLHVQVYQSKARFGKRDGGHTICGLTARHLDSWLMSPELCHETFVHGSRGADLALVLGQYQPGHCGPSAGGDLDTLCAWLDLPQLVVIDVTQLRDCQILQLPADTAGLLLDRVARTELPRWQTILEPLAGVPVLGALPRMDAERAMIEGFAAGDSPSRCLCEVLAGRLTETLQLRQLFGVMQCAALPHANGAHFQAGTKLAGLRVAVAYDEAFHCYFPDVLDLLELQGALVRDFSPLRDETLPAKTDIVYFGCGHPHRFAQALAANQCLALALRNHVCRGRRLYAEGGGLAYLCRYLHMPSGERLPMAGVMPAIADYTGDDPAPEPTEITVSRDSWLAPRGAKLRGYCNSTWEIRPAGPLVSHSGRPGRPADLVAHQQALGGRLQLNFAAQPDFLRRFSAAGVDPARSTLVQ